MKMANYTLNITNSPLDGDPEEHVWIRQETMEDCIKIAEPWIDAGRYFITIEIMPEDQ